MDVSSPRGTLVLGQIEPLLRPDDSNLRPDLASAAAINSFFEASLASDLALNAHLFAHGYRPPLRSTLLQRFADEKRILRKPLPLLVQATEQHPYMFLNGLNNFGSVAAVRAALGHVAFPITCVVPTANWADLLGLAAQYLSNAEDCDVILVTHAGVHETLRLAFDAVRDWSGTPTGRQLPFQMVEVHLPVDLERYRPCDRRAARRMAAWSDEKLVVLVDCSPSAGRRGSFDAVVSVFRELLKKHPNLFVVLMDSDVSERSVKSSGVKELISQGVLTTVSSPSQEHLPFWYSAADVFVVLEETLAAAPTSAVANAMACGVPVVATDWLWSRELIEDGKTGILVPTHWNPIAALMMSWMCADQASYDLLADQTILDTRALREGLDWLLSSQQVRINIAAAGRASVSRHRAFAPIAETLKSLWTEQLSRRVSGQPAKRPWNDFQRLFRHCASAELRLEQRVLLTPSSAAIRGDLLRGPNLTGVPALLRSDVDRALSVLETGPASLDQLVSNGSECALESVVWLLRKGYLEFEAAAMIEPPAEVA